MSVVGYFGGDLRGERTKEFVALEEGAKEPREDGEELPGGLQRAGNAGEFYECVEDYDPVLRWHCRL